MHIDGQPLLSRATVSSGRILITFALGIILAKAYAIESEAITILVAEIKTAKLSAPAMWVIIFMSVGHSINWYGDWASFYTWNSGKQLQTIIVDRHSEEPFLSQIESLVEAIELLKSIKKEGDRFTVRSPQLSKLLKERNEKLTQLQEKVESLKEGVERLDSIRKFELYGWHFAVPLALAVVAYFMLLLDIP